MIELQQVSKRYSSSTTILQSLSLTLAEHQFVCLLGPSGCGKTTLLNLIAGFIAPTSGKILMQGKPVVKPGPDRGVVFQDATLFPWMTVLDNVRFGLQQQGMHKEQATSIAREQLELVGMLAHQQAWPISLSGGQRQRVAIARTLALQPKVLLMDEPFSALDANSRERLQDELLRICTVRPTTVLYVTHHVDEAALLAERVLVMGPGPDNINADIMLPAQRPRVRSSEQFSAITAQLRAQLDTLPCCIAPSSQGEIEPCL
jgi:NitT/TauT family transport system ATP-binding protein